jgi:hypothetical protein
MPPATKDIATWIFKRKGQVESGKYALNKVLLNALFCLDGETPLAAVAKKIDMDMATLGKVMTELASMNLVEKIEKPQTYIDPQTIDFMTIRLKEATGPIAEMLIEDALEDMGLDIGRIPDEQFPGLIENLARDIPDEGLRAEFIKVMLSSLNK